VRRGDRPDRNQPSRFRRAVRHTEWFLLPRRHDTAAAGYESSGPRSGRLPIARRGLLPRRGGLPSRRRRQRLAGPSRRRDRARPTLTVALNPRSQTICAHLGLALHSPSYCERMFTDWPFVGRARELSELEGLLTEGRCNGVVLAGVAGVGKTRLAVEAL